MAQIRIERTPIKTWNLGVTGADHLLLTYVIDEFQTPLVQDNWYVIEGTKDIGGPFHMIGVDGADGRTTLSEAYGGRTGKKLEWAISTPEKRNSTVIEFPQGAFPAWETMAVVARDIDEQFLPYIFAAIPASPIPASNSSSVIATVLFEAGIDISQHLPFGWRNFTTGDRTLLGSAVRDEMFINDNFKNLMGGGGSDILHGSDGSDRLNGGRDADIFFWSSGNDYIHGGQWALDYASDGIDVMSYGGVGEIRIEWSPANQPHKFATWLTFYDKGTDHLFSIEKIQWNDESDSIILGRDVRMIEDDILFDLGGDQGLRGDKVSFAEGSDGMLINAVDGVTLSAQAIDRATDAAIFLQSAEWIEGSAAADQIYANGTLRVIEAGGGDDLIDARLDAAFGGGSPLGYDIELYGGAGDDTILSSAGRTLAVGGAGADRFILTAVNSGSGTPEFVIDGGEADDRLYVAYNFFAREIGDFEGSALMPVLGAMFPFDVLSDPEGTQTLLFDWQMTNDYLYSDSAVTGVFDFTGLISYSLDGSDLIITFYQGTPSLENIADPESPPWLFELSLIDADHPTIVRIKNFSEGMLGIEFHDPGEPQPIETPRGGSFTYPNWDQGIEALTNGGVMLEPLDPRPAPPTYDPEGDRGSNGEAQISGTTGGDVITTAVVADISAGAGNDHITGSDGDDYIDGGSGADVMAGGLGDDVYIVDASGDVVTEAASSGNDRVVALVSHDLAANIEVLDLAGIAVVGRGNALANRITGNELDNVLEGGAGDDTLNGNAGNDTLIGGLGADRYVVAPGEGDDIVIDAGLASEIDTLLIGGGALPAEVTVYRTAAAPGDLVLAFPTGGRVVIRDYAAAGSGIDIIRFDDGTVWDRSAILALGDATAPLGNAPPQALADDFLLVQSPVGSLQAALLTANDKDPEAGALTVTAVSAAAGGTVTLLPGGSILIETTPGYEGLVTFTYTVTDAAGATANAVATVTVLPNAAPVAVGSLPDRSFAGGAPLLIELPPGLYDDADGDALAIRAVLEGGAPLPSWLVFDEVAGTFAGTPPPGYSGSLEISIEATDGMAVAAHTFTLTVTSAAGETFNGTAGNDTFVGTPGNDVFTLVGDGGVDQIDGGAGTDTLRGSQWNDIVRLTANPANLTSVEIIDGGDGHDRILGGAGHDVIDASPFTLISIELIDGGAGNDTITGSAGADVIMGNVGNDTLAGGGGNDTFLVNGDGGFDTIDGGAGFDTIQGGLYNDVIRVSAGAAGFTGIERIDGGAGSDRILGGTGGDVIDLSGIEVVGIETIDGGTGNDTIIGSAGADVIMGNVGNDQLSGGGGDDTFLVNGDGGLDTILGGSGFDTILGGLHNEIIRVAAGSAGFTGIERIDLGAGFDRILGGSGNDVIDLGGVALAGVEGIDAGLGDDVIVTSLAADTIFGGDGNDRFVFRTDGGHDVIQDFRVHAIASPVGDTLDLRGLGFDSFEELMGSLSQVGLTDTLLTIDAMTSIRLVGVAPASLTAADVILA